MFLKAHWRSLVAADFLTVEVWKLRGRMTYYVLFFIELPTRAVWIAGITTNPAEGWMLQIARNARAPRRFIGWQTFFDFSGNQSANVRPPKMIDTKISSPLFNLPLGAIASGDRPTALPQRNLLRHLTWSLPSGQAIAGAMCVPALSPGELSELAPL